MLIKNTLDDKILLRLGRIFEEKSWKMVLPECGDITLFDRFCERLMELENDEDRDFMLDLTEKYMVIGLDQYENCLLDVISKFIQVENEKLNKIETIHIFPVQDKEYFDKTKSGNVVCYMTQGIIMRRFREFHEKRIRIIETYEGIEKHKNEIGLLLLIDDYVGTGDTSLACINLLEEIGIDKNRMIVISLAVQRVGKKLLKIMV